MVVNEGVMSENAQQSQCSSTSDSLMSDHSTSVFWQKHLVSTHYCIEETVTIPFLNFFSIWF
jgi:hypothetical protein